MMTEEAKRRRLADFIRKACGAERVSITLLERMSGGAVQQNWAVNAEIDGGAYAGAQAWVLRMDAPARVAESMTRGEEFRVLQAMQEARVLAPRPLWLCEDSSVAGSPFFIMERLPGIAAGHKVARDPRLVPDRARLARELAVNLARIHRVKPGQPGLDFLATMLARDDIAHYRAYLATLAESHPVLEWGLQWCERNAPSREETTLIHRDYRTGNYLVHEGALAGVLDWEFVAWGNPLEDVGWLFAKCWRFGQYKYVVGGVADPRDFLHEYEARSGRTVDAAALRYWQVMAHIRWAVIALQQRERHRSGIEPSLELALTGHILSDLELEILALSVHDGAMKHGAECDDGAVRRGVEGGSGAAYRSVECGIGTTDGPACDAMNNLPAGPDLLAIARETLVTELKPLLADNANYTLAMVANAMAIAARQAEAGEAPALAALARLDTLHGGPPRELHGAALRDAVREHERRLAADIRAGRYDANDGKGRALREHLLESVRAKLRISNPKSLES